MRLCCLMLLAGVMIIFASNDVSAVSDGFSIYLADEENYGYNVTEENFRNINLQDKPIISIDDIIAYNKDTHEMTLIPSAYDRFVRVKDRAPGFVVCVGNERIYAGRFWSRLSSRSCDSVVILESYEPPESYSYSIRLQLGYPTEEWFKGKDPRSDPRILCALEKAGKLKEDRTGTNKRNSPMKGSNWVVLGFLSIVSIAVFPVLILGLILKDSFRRSRVVYFLLSISIWSVLTVVGNMIVKAFWGLRWGAIVPPFSELGFGVIVAIILSILLTNAPKKLFGNLLLFFSLPIGLYIGAAAFFGLGPIRLLDYETLMRGLPLICVIWAFVCFHRFCDKRLYRINNYTTE